MNQNALSEPVERFLQRQDVLAMIGVRSPTTLYALIRNDGFPAPYAVTEARRVWSLREVQRWIDQKKRQRNSMA